MNASPIPPHSIIRLIKSDGTPFWFGKVGRKCRVGYYSPADGLDVIWIVDQFGDYVETTDLSDFHEWFVIVELADAGSDYYGDDSAPFTAISDEILDWQWTA